MVERGTTHHPLKNYYWTPEQLASFTTIALTTAGMPTHDERLLCKIHSATPVFCKGEVHQSAFEILLKIHSSGKEQFDRTSQNSFVIHGCELQISFRMLSPSESSKTSLALRPGSGHQRFLSKTRKRQNKTTNSPKTLFCLLWWRNWERESLLSSM